MEVGKQYRVTENLFGHGFPIGQLVRFVEFEAWFPEDRQPLLFEDASGYQQFLNISEVEEV